MRFPSRNEPLADIPKNLLEDIGEGDAVFFLGSSFLKPPRYEHLSAITNLVTDAIREYNSKKDIVTEYPLTDRLKFFDEQLNQLKTVNIFLSTYGKSEKGTQIVKDFVNSLKAAFTSRSSFPSSFKNDESEGRIKDETSEVEDYFSFLYL